VRKFEYADEKIGAREIMIAGPAMIMGVGILSLPRILTKEMIGSDGWVSILLCGVLFICLAWGIATIVSLFPGKSFTELTSTVASKPVSIIITLMYAFLMLHFASYTVSSFANVTGKYIMYRTPFEVIAFAFFLVVIYAVSGSRVGLLRLNVMFFPIVIFIVLVVMVLSLSHAKFDNLLPVFQTDFKGYVQGVKSGMLSFVGISILWFYTPYMRHPEEAPGRVAFGIGFVTLIYLLLFIITLGVFGHVVTSNLVYPTVELAKSIEIPGEFFERFESLFFVIWIMILFNSASMALDILTLALTSIFTRFRKRTVLYIVSPLVFFIAMVPEDVVELKIYGSLIGYTAFIYTMFVVVLLFLVMKIRGVR